MRQRWLKPSVSLYKHNHTPNGEPSLVASRARSFDETHRMVHSGVPEEMRCNKYVVSLYTDFRRLATLYPYGRFILLYSVPFFLKLGFASGAVREDLSGPCCFWKPPPLSAYHIFMYIVRFCLPALEDAPIDEDVR